MTNDDELHEAVRSTLEAIGDEATPAADFDSILARQSARSDGARPRRPGLLLSGVAAAVVLLVVGLGVVRSARDEGTDPEQGAVVTVETPTEPAPSIQVGDPTTTDDHATLPPTERVAEVTGIPLEEIERLRVAALRNLVGFNATVTTSDTVPTPYPIARTVDLTALADGSFWSASESTGEFESYDTTTQIARRAERPEGEGQALLYSENNGETVDNMRYRFSGHQPTEPISMWADAGVDISESTWDERPAWTITFDHPEREPIDEASDGDYATHQVDLQILDQETGLIVVHADSKIGVPDETRRTEYTHLTITSDLPAEFPGVFPPGAEVQVSPNYYGGAPIGFDDVPAYFGVATPLPGIREGFEATINPIGNDVPGGDRLALRFIEMVRKEGFLRTMVSITATEVAPEFPTGVVRNGYLCEYSEDQDDDGDCDPPDFGAATIGSGPRLTTLDVGLFDGFEALVDDDAAGSGAVTTGVGPFLVNVSAPDVETARAVIDSFVLVEP